jgi:hypothetical protein
VSGRGGRLDDQQQAEQLDRHVQLGLAQDSGLESGFHEAGEGAFQHDQEGQAEQADGHGVAGREIVAVEHQVLGDEEGRQHDHEEGVVAVAVLAAVANQRPQQHGGDGAEKEVVGQHGDRQRQAAAEAHGQALDDPGCGQQHQCRAVVAADIDPVLGRGEQEAAQHGPAEAEEHFVGMPLHRGERAAGAGRAPLNISAQAIGSSMPDRQARAKKGRKPTSQSG